MKNKLALAIVGFFAIVTGSIVIAQPQAKADGYAPNCGPSAVVKCGAYTQEQLDSRITAEAQQLYRVYGIGTNLSSAKQGIVNPDGTVVVDGKVVATGAMTFGRVKRTSSDISYKMSNNVVFYKHSIADAAIAKPVEAHVFYDANGQFVGAIIKMCGNPVVAVPVPRPKPQALVCSNLTATITDRTNRKVKVTVTGSASNTTISGYKIDFGDGTVVNQQTAEHTYAKDGSYSITGYVSGSVNGKPVTVSGPNCKSQKEFTPPPVQGLQCESLTRVSFDQNKRYIKVTVSGSAAHTTIDSYKIDFGDGTVVNQQTAEHTYAKDGSYKIVGHVGGTVNGSAQFATSVNCEQSVSFEQPGELPKTGPGAIVGLFAGASVISAAGYRIWMARRLS